MMILRYTFALISTSRFRLINMLRHLHLICLLAAAALPCSSQTPISVRNWSWFCASTSRRATAKRGTQSLTAHDEGIFLQPDLVDLKSLDPSIKFDIRYATAHNFLGTPAYSQARAFLERPAAEALKRANEGLKSKGYALLVYDAYRPWYVTKMFWDAIAYDPEKKRDFVADPATGSIHN